MEVFEFIPFYLHLNLLAFILWFWFRKRLEKELSILGYYLIFCFVVELAAAIYSWQNHGSNHKIYNVFTTIQLIFLSLIYGRILTEKIQLKLIKIFIFVYPLLVVANLNYIQSSSRFHTITYTIGVLFVVTLFFSYFNQLLHSEEILSLRKTPLFWFNIGNTVHFVGSLFYYGSINFINETAQDRYGELIQIFIYSFTAIQYIFFIISILCNLRQEAN